MRDRDVEAFAAVMYVLGGVVIAGMSWFGRSAILGALVGMALVAAHRCYLAYAPRRRARRS